MGEDSKGFYAGKFQLVRERVEKRESRAARREFIIASNALIGSISSRKKINGQMCVSAARLSLSTTHKIESSLMADVLTGSKSRFCLFKLTPTQLSLVCSFKFSILLLFFSRSLCAILMAQQTQPLLLCLHIVEGSTSGVDYRDEVSIHCEYRETSPHESSPRRLIDSWTRFTFSFLLREIAASWLELEIPISTWHNRVNERVWVFKFSSPFLAPFFMLLY